MNYWLMSLKYGKEGKLFFKSCFRNNVIACGWWNNKGESAGDLREYKTYENFLSFWRYTETNIQTDKQLWIFYKEMKKGDIVYIRGDSRKDKKATIIGKCEIILTTPMVKACLCCAMVYATSVNNIAAKKRITCVEVTTMWTT